MGKIETTPQENIDDHEEPPSSTPHSHTSSSSSSPSSLDHPEDIDKTLPVASSPEPTHSHAPPSSSNQQVAPENAAVRRQQQPQLDNEIESIPAVVFPPQSHPRPPEANNNEGSGGGDGGNGPAQPATSGRAHLVLIQAEGNPWSSGLFDFCQHPLNGIYKFHFHSTFHP